MQIWLVHPEEELSTLYHWEVAQIERKHSPVHLHICKEVHSLQSNLPQTTKNFLPGYIHFSYNLEN